MLILLAINSHTVSFKLADQAITNLSGIKAHKIHLVWVKTHIGNEGIEKADELAKQGTTLAERVDVLPLLPMVCSELNTCIQAEWEHRWMQYKAGRQTKQFLPYLNNKAAKTSLALSRIKLGRFVCLVTVQNNLNYHMSLCNPGHTYKCRFCNLDKETFFHFCTICPSFNQTRSQYFFTL